MISVVAPQRAIKQPLILLSRIVRYTESMDESDAPKYPPVEAFSSPTIDPTPQQDEPRQERDLSRYSLTAEEASELFIHAGVPRSLRTVIRYCSNKTLDCTKVDTERSLKYLVAKESVDNRIVELQQIAALGYGTPHLEATRHGETIDEPRPAMASHDATPDADQKIHELTGRVGELERENERLEREKMNLEITNRVKDAVIKKNESLLETAHSQLMRFNRAVGTLTERLRLTAPKEDTSQILAYLDTPSQPADLEHENFVDA